MISKTHAWYFCELGRTLWEGDLIVGTGSPGMLGSHCPQRNSGRHWIWHLGLWFSWQGVHWSRVGFNAFRGLFQPSCSCGCNLAVDLSSLEPPGEHSCLPAGPGGLVTPSIQLSGFSAATLQQQGAEKKSPKPLTCPVRGVSEWCSLAAAKIGIAAILQDWPKLPL